MRRMQIAYRSNRLGSDRRFCAKCTEQQRRWINHDKIEFYPVNVYIYWLLWYMQAWNKHSGIVMRVMFVCVACALQAMKFDLRSQLFGIYKRICTHISDLKKTIKAFCVGARTVLILEQVEQSLQDLCVFEDTHEWLWILFQIWRPFLVVKLRKVPLFEYLLPGPARQ